MSRSTRDSDLIAEPGATGSGPRTAAEAAQQARGVETANTLLQAGVGAADESSALPERGPLAGMAELRAGDRPLTERAPGDLTTADRGPRLAMQQFAGQAGWGEEIQGKLQWLSRQGMQRAELQLHPAELGSIDVRISSENDQTSVVFLAANRSARELLEAEIPRLRELFSQVGVELGQVDVSDRQAGDRQQFATRDESYDGDHNSAVKQNPGEADTESGESSLPAVGGDSGSGMIDYYI
jgi:flagellar hook-length control protein FliK